MSQNLLTYFSIFGPSQHSLRLLLETSLGKIFVAVSSTRTGLVFLRSSEPKHQATTDPGSAPGRAAGPVGLRNSEHALRISQEISLGKTLAAVGSTRAGLCLPRCSKAGAHGLAADLATGGGHLE